MAGGRGGWYLKGGDSAAERISAGVNRLTEEGVCVDGWCV